MTAIFLSAADNPLPMNSHIHTARFNPFQG